MGGAIVALLILPFLNTSQIRNSNFRPIYAWLFWFFVADFALLGWLGAKDVDEPYVTLGIISALYYFGFFFVIIPGLGYVEEKLYNFSDK